MLQMEVILSYFLSFIFCNASILILVPHHIYPYISRKLKCVTKMHLLPIRDHLISRIARVSSERFSECHRINYEDISMSIQTLMNQTPSV